eukprot:scaffold61969_cov48-Prasinocladus_malaysianus.AAC.2
MGKAGLGSQPWQLVVSGFSSPADVVFYLFAGNERITRTTRTGGLVHGMRPLQRSLCDSAATPCHQQRPVCHAVASNENRWPVIQRVSHNAAVWHQQPRERRATGD